jgi:spore germination protein PC
MIQEVNQIWQSMQTYMVKQDKKIQQLQQKIYSLEQRIIELQNRPPVHIEKMEYKFDQLKVETLEGTLNIGLNPADLQNIEDFSVPSKKGPPAIKERMVLFTEIENSIHDYLDKNLLSIMKEAGEQLQFQADEAYQDFISQDIKKQLTNRIEYYLNQPQKFPESAAQEQKDWIIEQLIKEIHHGVLTFLQNLPENMKGMKTE